MFILIDGVPSTEGHWGGLMASPGVDSVSEMQIIRNTCDAQFGRSGGGVVNVSTKGGSQRLHGTAFEYLRNDNLDANNFFNNANNRPLSEFKRNQFGGNVRLESAKPDARPAVLCDDVEDLDMTGLAATTSGADQPVVVLRDTREAFVRDCRTLGDATAFVRVEGAGSRDITVAGNLLRRVKTAVETSAGANPGSVRETGNLR